MPTTSAKKPRELVLSEAMDGVVGVRLFCVRADWVQFRWSVAAQILNGMTQNYWLYALLRKAYHFRVFPATQLRESAFSLPQNDKSTRRQCAQARQTTGVCTFRVVLIALGNSVPRAVISPLLL